MDTFGRAGGGKSLWTMKGVSTLFFWRSFTGQAHGAEGGPFGRERHSSYTKTSRVAFLLTAVAIAATTAYFFLRRPELRMSTTVHISVYVFIRAFVKHPIGGGMHR